MLCAPLSACAEPDPNAARSASAPPPLHDRLSGENQRLEVRIRTAPGQETALNHWFSLRADCSAQDYFRIETVWAPAHGQLAIRTGRFRPDYPSDNYRALCNDQPRDGIAAFYRPAPGWHGEDGMTLRIEAPSGKRWTTDFVVTTG